ncbi:hypothetical protein ACKWTF_006765 [Chironomus riparius]
MIALLIFALQIFIASSSSAINTSMYYQMPNMYKYDDYNECLGIFNDEAVYCIANVKIQHNSSSELNNFIVEYSSNHKQHYRHDKLKRGLCVNYCLKLIGNLSDITQYHTRILNNSYGLSFFNAEMYREKYDEVVNTCINIELIDKFGLKGFTEVQNCIDNEYQNYRNNAIDYLDKIVAILLAVILFTIISSSLFDRYLRNTIHFNDNSKLHYQSSLQSKSHQILTLFSIRRNWYILSCDSKAEFHDLKIFQWIRTFTFWCVILGHVLPMSIAFPILNPIYIEDFYSKLTSMFVVNGNIFVQSFFFMSGFLSAYLFMLYREKDKCSNWIFFVKAIIFRYLRLIPLLLFMMLLHATWLYHMGDGPFWDENVLDDREFCRKNWWINLILLSNYIGIDQICMLHGWYLSADFWLSVLGYACLILIYKYPSLKNWIISSVLGLSIFLTGYVVYVNKFEPISIVSPEAFRNHLIPVEPDDLDYFRLYYAPTHMNLGSYFVGIFGGLWYRDIRATKVDYRRRFYFRFIWYCCLLLGFVLVLSGYLFYQYDFEKPSIWVSLAAIIIRHSWGVILAFGIIGVIYHHGWFTRNLLSYKGFKILGRISYAGFICHVFILKLLMMRTHQMMEISMQNMFTITIACFVLSNFIGFFLTLCIEIPISSLLKVLTLKRTESIEKFNDSNEEIK